MGEHRRVKRARKPFTRKNKFRKQMQTKMRIQIQEKKKPRRKPRFDVNDDDVAEKQNNPLPVEIVQCGSLFFIA